MMSVRVDAQIGPRPSPPVRLFSTNILAGWGLSRYAVTGDGQRFLGLEPVGGVPSFMFLLNWPEPGLGDRPSPILPTTIQHRGLPRLVCAEDLL